MSLQGAAQLQSRLRALSTAARPISEAWGRETLTQARQRIRVRTGATRSSLRLVSATEDGARIVGSAVAAILDRGHRAYDIEPRSRETMKFRGRGRTVFSKKVHKPRAQGSRIFAAAAREGLRRADPDRELVRAWNRGA